jgi:uncharacterized protein YndB with AHSA1/START domain
MTSPSVIHSTFSLERRYDVPPARVYSAWSDPAEKQRWFAGQADRHELDFRVGGRELVRARREGVTMGFDACYRDIVPERRIVFTATLSAGDALATVSLTTVELAPDGEGTRLRLVEQGTFLDGHEDPSWRERGTGQWLDALGQALADSVRP